MNIMTKKGDGGQTYFCAKTPVPKDHIRIEACGAVDELSAFISFARSIIKGRKEKRLLEGVQRDLSLICAELAGFNKNKQIECVGITHVERIEDNISDFQEQLGEKNGFLLFGANPFCGALDVARAVARRAERRAVSAYRKKITANRFILVYLNRLSDMLYLMARFYTSKKRVSSIQNRGPIERL